SACHARFLRDIGEFHPAIVSIQAVEELWRIFLQTRNRRTVCEEDVHSSVVVVIKGGNSARHRFDHVLTWRRMVLKHEVQPGMLGYLTETDGRKCERRL